MNISDVIEDVCEKYSYSIELKEALKRCIPVMIDGKSEEEVRLLVKALYNVEIFIFDKNPTREQVDNINRKKLNHRNSHVKFEPSSPTSYFKEDQKATSAAYSYEIIFDEKMNAIDKSEYLYLTKLTEGSTIAQTYGTTIDLSALIHELGHAWAAQEKPYVQDKDGNIEIRQGFRSNFCMVDRKNCTVKEEKQEGLYIEEAMNTIEEEKAITKLLGVSNVNEIQGYRKSVYQSSLMNTIMRVYLEKIAKNTPFQKARMFGDYSGLERFQATFLRTTFMKKMHNEKYMTEKKNHFLRDIPENAKDFFKRYNSIYFSAQNKGGFLENLDSVLGQLYALNAGWSIMRKY